MRVPTSCSVCRKRKIKCDKIRPTCGSCAKSNVPHLCHFEEPLWVNSKDLWRGPKPTSPPSVDPTRQPSISGAVNSTPSDQASSKQVFDELAARVKHIEASIAVSDLARSGSSYQEPPQSTNHSHAAAGPYGFSGGADFLGSPQRAAAPQYDFNPDETIEIFGYIPFVIKKSRLEYHGGLDPKTIIKKDPHLKIVWAHLWKNFDISLQSKMRGARNDGYPESPAKQVSLDHQSFLEFLELKKQKQIVKKSTEDLLNSDVSLNDIIIRSLPSRKCIMTLCFRFFKVVYPILPFVNENSFFGELESIFDTWNEIEARPTKVVISSKYDYATIGLLFLMMRFGQITLEPEDYNKQEFECIKNVDINAGHVMIARKCLDQYNFLRKSYSLRVLQLLLYLKMYFRYCPEDDDVSDGSGGRIMMGTIYSVALSLGLQTDPNELVSLIKSPKTQSYGQLWRKMWHKILELDATQAVSLGVAPNCTNEAIYDTKLPEAEEFMDDVDSYVVEDFKLVDKKTALYRKIANTCFNVRRKPTVLQMVHLVREIENFMSVNFGSLKSILGDSNVKSYVKAKKVSYLYEMNSLLLALKSRLLNHFFSTGNAKKVFEYFDESLTLTMKILNSSLNMYYNMDLYFDRGHKVMLRPVAYLAIEKAILLIGGVLAKLSQCRKLISPTDVTRMNCINDLFYSLLSNMNGSIQLMSTVSTGYYNSQKILLAMKMFFDQVSDPLFDFDKAAKQAAQSTARDKMPANGNMSHEIHVITADDIPKSNFIMLLMDSELAYLKAKTEHNLNEVLQPLTATGSGRPPTSNPSGAGNGQFYDPTVDSVTAKSPLPRSTLNDVPVNMNEIFSNTRGSTSAPVHSAMQYDPTSLSDDEYASLFGFFEDYNLLNLDKKDLRGL
ncbi:CYFA0S01e14730g1_1 [Cyberlindnera fabianii]|uniref:CYFA0S01e14730g1_1 n=1 Tax=Cyberlindnera fabianii TaxID=36022 RepID=A0A061AKL0_CYBFA|nr:CYFA0S01e14730g1_1 [Cyberlindnera fabianii]